MKNAYRMLLVVSALACISTCPTGLSADEVRDREEANCPGPNLEPL